MENITNSMETKRTEDTGKFYQKKFVCTDFTDIARNNREVDEIIKIFENHNIRGNDDKSARCCYKIRFVKSVSMFKRRMNVLIVDGIGEALDSRSSLFDTDGARTGYSKEEKALINRVKLISSGQFKPEYEAGVKAGNVKILEQLTTLPDLSGTYKILKGMSEKIMAEVNGIVTKDGDMADYSDVERVNSIMERNVTEVGFSFDMCETKKSIHSNVRDFTLYLNDKRIGHIVSDEVENIYHIDMEPITNWRKRMNMARALLCTAEVTDDVA